MLPRLVVGGILAGVCYMYKRGGRGGCVCVCERESREKKGVRKVGRKEEVMGDGLCCRFDVMVAVVVVAVAVV